MHIPTERWHQALKVRKSRRQFNSQAIPLEIIAKLEELCLELNSKFTGVRTALVNHNPDRVFKGAIGSYGKIKGAPAYVAFIGDLKAPEVQVKLGYMGEAFILEATALGLGTCWVGGFFKPDVVAEDIKLSVEEKVLSVTPIGYAGETFNREERLMVNLASSHKRKDLAKLCSGLPEKEWSDWVHSALEAARIAPSAVNRQPWRFHVERDSITIAVDSQLNLTHISKRLDCGIAMLHLEIGALAKGVTGTWTYLDSPQVAVFRPTKIDS
ncbi:MAG TPA: nitroreductase family protein [Candidatus Deferrimicrobium sp.]|nr:nitroreductase family protein [Candidatus Deferrimicrobium sp.]